MPDKEFSEPTLTRSPEVSPQEAAEDPVESLAELPQAASSRVAVASAAAEKTVAGRPRRRTRDDGW
ncbi:hypothetical protein GOARA_076_00510 [Gordonia araii NBRC 100433]|uniref:Uncharacterized protein n=1 Tax=Gordonia araii NBRC 100433 TaxID=1073574 RepID=G7H6R6_9ACTN|nr:hypothetical protein GOARA_076_00510 [Gordonia araii NBRC 100433]